MNATIHIWTCDRCGRRDDARKPRNSDDDDGKPFDWSFVLGKDLCHGCTDQLKQFLGGAMLERD